MTPRRSSPHCAGAFRCSRRRARRTSATPRRTGRMPSRSCLRSATCWWWWARKSSSNSNRLRELADRAGIPGYLVDGPEDLRREWFDGKQLDRRHRRGIRAGGPGAARSRAAWRLGSSRCRARSSDARSASLSGCRASCGARVPPKRWVLNAVEPARAAPATPSRIAPGDFVSQSTHIEGFLQLPALVRPGPIRQARRGSAARPGARSAPSIRRTSMTLRARRAV